MRVNMSFVMVCLDLAARVYENKTMSSFSSLLVSGGKVDYEPRFEVLRNGKDLYIVIRGSTEVSDFNIILDFYSEDAANGHMHAGCLRAARWILDICRDFIDQCDGRIVFTGHSMGGSIAAIAAALLRLEENDKRAYAVAFAPFPCMSQDIANLAKEFTLSFIVNRDIIPSLNPMNMKRIVNTLVSREDNGKSAKSFTEMIRMFTTAMITGVVGKDPTEEEKKKIQEESAKINARIMINSERADTIGQLVNPGMAYHVIITDGKPDVILFNEDTTLAGLLDIFVNIADHMITVYRDVLSHSMRAKWPTK